LCIDIVKAVRDPEAEAAHVVEAEASHASTLEVEAEVIHAPIRHQEST